MTLLPDSPHQSHHQEQPTTPQSIDLATTNASTLSGSEKKKYEKRVQAVIECYRLLQEWPELANMYKITSKIGEGSFSIVYKAIDLIGKHRQQVYSGLGTSNQNNPSSASNCVAIKHVFGNASCARILSEVRILADLRGHPNVACLLDIHRHKHNLIFVMPYWEHPQFLDYFRTLPINELRYYFSCLAAALDFCHGKGIIHRDVKPNNYIYNPARRHGVLVDFGLAQHYQPPPKPSNPSISAHHRLRSLDAYLDPTKSIHHHHQNIVNIPELSLGIDQPACVLSDKRPFMEANRAGTRGFRAPEVLFKCQIQTPVVDIWSIGVTLLCFLTRKFPFFPSENDITALQEIAVLFGARTMKRLARTFDRIFLSTLPTIPNQGVNFRDLVYTLNPNEFNSIPIEAFQFLERALTLNPKDRITAHEAMHHPWLRGVSSFGTWHDKAPCSSFTSAGSYTLPPHSKIEL